MIDILKKSLYAGIGATVVTAEKVEEALQDLVSKGKLSAEEAQSTFKKVAEESKKEFEESQDSLTKLFEELLHKANVATQSDIDEIKARLEKLESEKEVASES